MTFKKSMRGPMMKAKLKKNINQILKKSKKKMYSFLDGNGQILMFHRIVEKESNLQLNDIEATVDDVEYVIKYFLDKDYLIISLDQVYDFLTSKIKFNKKFVVFTFDDGYKDNYTLAYPLFKKYNAPFTIYLTTGFPNQTIKMWWYGLNDLINKSERIDFEYNGIPYLYNLKNQTEKISAWNDLHNLIMSKGFDRDLLFEKIFLQNNIDLENYRKDMALTWTELEILSADPLVTIGAHTINHHNSVNLTPNQLVNEIKGSKDEIEEFLKIKVHHFAFPYGGRKHANKREIQIAENLGFKTVVTTRFNHVIKILHKNNITLPRVELNHEIIEKEIRNKSK